MWQTNDEGDQVLVERVKRTRAWYWMSGVGGGILAIAPGKASIAVWSPGLDEAGNSHLGRIALEDLARRTGWSIFGP